MIRYALVVGALLFVLGCGSQSEPDTTDYSPLTVEQWKQMPAEVKYDIGTLERLKEGNPKLYQPREWNRFTREVLLPMKRQELPNG